MGIGADILGTGQGIISEAQGNFQSQLQNGITDDPASLIQMQYNAFIFTNSVTTVGGSLGSVSSATQSAASKIGS